MHPLIVLQSLRAELKRIARPCCTSVPCLIDHLVLGDPRHHSAQLRADFFDLVLVVAAADAHPRLPGTDRIGAHKQLNDD